MRVPARANKWKRDDVLSEICCFPNQPLLRYCYFIAWWELACVLLCAWWAELVNPSAVDLQEKGCNEWWWQVLALRSYFAVKAGGGAAKRKVTSPWPDFTPCVRCFLLEKGELLRGAEQAGCGGKEAPACRERQVDEGRSLKTGGRRNAAGLEGAEQGSNSPLTRPQSNMKRDFPETHEHCIICCNSEPFSSCWTKKKAWKAKDLLRKNVASRENAFTNASISIQLCFLISLFLKKFSFW